MTKVEDLFKEKFLPGQCVFISEAQTPGCWDGVTLGSGDLSKQRFLGIKVVL